MKILYICSKFCASNSGAATHIQEIIRVFKKSHCVKTLVAEDTKGNTNVIRLPRPSAMVRLRRAIKKVLPNLAKNTVSDIQAILESRSFQKKYMQEAINFNPDVIYERSECFHSVALKFSQKLHCPFFLEVNVCFTEAQRGKWSPLNSFGKKLDVKKYFRASGIFVVSSALKDALTSMGIPEKKMYVLSNAANPEDYQKRNLNTDPVVTELSKKLARKIVVGFVGNLLPTRGIHILPEVCDEIIQSLPNVHFLVIGRGEKKYMGDIENDIRNRHLESYFTFTGVVDYQKLSSYIDLFDIVILPRTNLWGCPVKIFACGIMRKPIIAPRIGPILDFMEEGKDGLLIKNGSTIELKKAILRLGGDKKLAECLAYNFHHKVLRNYTWGKIGRGMLAIMQRVVMDDMIRNPNRNRNRRITIEHSSDR